VVLPDVDDDDPLTQPHISAASVDDKEPSGRWKRVGFHRLTHTGRRTKTGDR
jgi:hypothetical protein